jgi:hypothetical protein
MKEAASHKRQHWVPRGTPYEERAIALAKRFSITVPPPP